MTDASRDDQPDAPASSSAQDPVRLARRLERERAARQEAEAIAERVTGELYGALQELTAVNESLRDFVAVAAHDLRAPLTGVLGFTSLLRERWDRLDDDQRREFIDGIERAGRQLERLVDDLMTISRIEAGELHTRAEAIELRAVVDLAIESAARNTPVELEVGSDLVVVADPDHVRRALVNYLSNAVKYGAPPVELRAEPVDGWIDVHVTDHGEGVPDEFAPRLFDRFARAEGARSNGVAGTGLGLAIVRGLAQANGGDAWYEQHGSAGACFVLRVPGPTLEGAAF